MQGLRLNFIAFFAADRQNPISAHFVPREMSFENTRSGTSGHEGTEDFCPTGETRYPSLRAWMPAYAGMTIE